MCVNATKLAAENAFNGDHFPFIGNKYQNVRKETYFEFLFKIIMRTLMKLKLPLKKLTIKISLHLKVTANKNVIKEA